ncbi:hypothetical protein Mapa_009418 [Marchantia paleacea]|nr:hypothetical protein Mapa_009418 [Marchantia paleacea]
MEETLSHMALGAEGDHIHYPPEYVKGNRIEGGGAESIHRALTRDGKVLVLKKVEITSSDDDWKLADELCKIEILKGSAHPNVVRYRNCTFRAFDKVLRVEMSLDFVFHETLEERYREFKLTDRQVGLYTRDILNGIAYLHEKNIVHRDIRCANIWIDEKSVCKLVNFGKAKELRYRKYDILSISKVGQAHWMAPELTEYGQRYTEQVDIWSLGCTVLEMLTRRKPYEADGEVSEKQVVAFLKESQGPTIPANLSPTAQNFLKRCLQIKPENRTTALDLLQDPFVVDKDASLPLQSPEETKKDAAIPLQSPEETKKDAAIPLQSPEETKKDSAIPLQSPEETKKDAAITLQSPEETDKDAANPLQWPEETDDVNIEHVASPGEGIESQLQNSTIASSVEQMCHQISEELEKHGHDLNLVLIVSSNWLEKSQPDADKVYTKLSNAGYLKTFETDTYSCFENILNTADGDCCCTDAPTSLKQSPNRVDEAPQNNEGYADSTSNSQSVNSEGVLKDDFSVRNSGLKSDHVAHNSREQNVFTAAENDDSRNSGQASYLNKCTPIPLQILMDGASSSSLSSTYLTPRTEASISMALDTGSRIIKVPITLSCCVRDKEIHIKFKCFKGEIYNFPSGSVLVRTRLAISATVSDQHVILKPVDPSHDKPRVCSVGEATWAYSRETRGNPWYAKISPSIQSIFGGFSLGEFGVTKNHKETVEVCRRKEPLKLVTLSAGHAGCSRLDFQKVLVLERNVPNTMLAREHKDVTCVDAQADANPIRLTGTFDPIGTQGMITVQITCCAELAVGVIPWDDIDKNMKREMQAVKRKETIISLCDMQTHGHVTFTGSVHTFSDKNQ